MNKSRVQLIILCEDKRHHIFIYNFLKEKGLITKNIRVNNSPSKGAGDQYVREQFTKELRYYRSRTASAILIVMIDGDLKSIQERIEKLKRECDVENIEFRKNDEKVLIVVPARNIETWVYFLQGNKVDDRADYKRKVSDKDCKNTAKKLVEMCDNKEPLTGCPSLIAACEEYRSVFLSN